MRHRSTSLGKAKVVAAACSLVPLVLLAPAAAAVPTPPGGDVPTCHGVPATNVGTANGDRLVGTAGRDLVVGLTGSDDIRSLGGNDLICGNRGTDRLDGGKSDDVVHAGRNGCGEDYCNPDLIFAGPGADRLDGGPGGRDMVSYAESPGPVVARLAVSGEPGSGVVRGEGRDVFVAIEGVVGSVHDDRIIGSPGPDSILLEDIGARGGQDVVRLGAGDDRLVAHDPEPDDIRGGPGNDSFEIMSALVQTGPGDDYVTTQDAGDGPEEVMLEIRTGTGNDTVSPHRSAEATVALGPDDDRLLSDDLDASVTVSGGAGDDELVGGRGDDDLSGGPGDDLLDGGDGDDVGDGGPHRVQDLCRNIEVPSGCEDVPDPSAHLTCQGEEATIVGTPYDDELTGTAGRDVIVARSGADRVSALDGDDLVCGASGRDVVLGDAGDDVLRDGAGVDRLEGGPGDDDLTGRGHGWGRPRGDVLVPGSGDDRVASRSHPSGRSAHVSYADSEHGVIVDLGAGTATGEGTDTLVGITDLEGSAFADDPHGLAGARLPPARFRSRCGPRTRRRRRGGSRVC